MKCFYKLMSGGVCLLAGKVLVSRVVDSDTIQLDDGDSAELRSPDGGLVASWQKFHNYLRTFKKLLSISMEEQ